MNAPAMNFPTFLELNKVTANEAAAKKGRMCNFSGLGMRHEARVGKVSHVLHHHHAIFGSGDAGGALLVVSHGMSKHLTS
eukprot:scaffold46435_cov59-Attheya_sp.AAC.1